MYKFLILMQIHGIIRIWHVKSGNCLNVLGFDKELKLTYLGVQNYTTDIAKDVSDILNDPITSLQIDTERLLVGTLSGHLYLYNVKQYGDPGENTNQQFLFLQEWANNPSSFKLYVNVSHKSTIRCWGLCAKNDAWRLISGTSFGTIGVWNHRTGKLLYSLDEKGLQITSTTKANPCAFTGLAFDDFFILASGTDGMVRVWQPIA
jgi:WD40 repeat protein